MRACGDLSSDACEQTKPTRDTPDQNEIRLNPLSRDGVCRLPMEVFGEVDACRFPRIPGMTLRAEYAYRHPPYAPAGVWEERVASQGSSSQLFLRWRKDPHRAPSVRGLDPLAPRAAPPTRRAYSRIRSPFRHWQSLPLPCN